MVTAKKLHEYVNQLCREEVYDPEEGVWSFRSGGSCCRCADSAIKVIERYGGRIIGFNCSQNPSARIGKSLCEGHDFAYVAERFIVDYWAFQVARVINRPVLDMRQTKNRKVARQIYGDKKTWEDVIINRAN
jgi:hypothetical protein